MRITQATRSYNERRYGKPWIATVDFSDPKGTFNFGQWIGAKGQEGELVVEAAPGDVVAQGQKDNRGSSSTDYHIVQQDGSLGSVVTKIEAYKAWQAKNVLTANQIVDALDAAKQDDAQPINLTAVPTEQLLAELRRRGALA